jgi:hypothetical protein
MHLPELAFAAVDWSACPVEDHPGADGISRWQTHESNGLRTRLVEYSRGYVADHWCDLGHVFLVLEGEVVIRLRDDRQFTLKETQGFCASDHGDAAHLVLSPKGARVFIVD